jgi:hypothetical protein
MAGLRTRRAKTAAAAAEPERASRLTGAQITDTRHFPTPIQGLVGQEPVRILSTGNVPGLSPGLLVVDTEGNLEWIGLREVQVNDPNFLPAMLPKIGAR